MLDRARRAAVLIRILHTADIHLDAPLASLALRDEGLRETVAAATRGAFERIVERAIAERVAALLISGDLFDGHARSARTAAFLIGQFERLHAAGIRSFYIKGNHDAENPVTGALDLPEGVHLFDARGGKVQLDGDIWIHGVSFADRHAPESLLPRFGAPVPGAVNIAMLHTSLAGAPGHDPYAPCSVEELRAMGFDYWALGHVHKRQVHADGAPWVVMPGTPQGRDIGETGPKSATLLSIGEGRIEISEVPTSVVEFTRATVDATEVESDDALRARLRAALRETAAGLRSETGVVRVRLGGTTRRRWQILRDADYWQAQAAEIARETGALWLDALRFDLDMADAPGATGTAVGELAALMERIAEEPGPAAAARAELDAVIADLPPAVRARLLPDEQSAESLHRALSERGARRVLARLRGAEG
jgi:DNA repair exonuclease SbcCD nuclease subunit